MGIWRAMPEVFLWIFSWDLINEQKFNQKKNRRSRKFMMLCLNKNSCKRISMYVISNSCKYACQEVFCTVRRTIDVWRLWRIWRLFGFYQDRFIRITDFRWRKNNLKRFENYDSLFLSFYVDRPENFYYDIAFPVFHITSQGWA